MMFCLLLLCVEEYISLSHAYSKSQPLRAPNTSTNTKICVFIIYAGEMATKRKPFMLFKGEVMQLLTKAIKKGCC